MELSTEQSENRTDTTWDLLLAVLRGFRMNVRDDHRMAGRKVDNLVDVSHKRRANNSMRREQCLCLGRVVDLLNKEVRDGVVGQASNSW